MHNGIYNTTRAALLVILALTFAAFCVTEHRTTYPEYIEPTTAPSEPSEPLETEPPTETTAPVTETAVATVALTAPEPSEAWESLGTFKLTAYCSCQSCCGYWATIRPSDENGTPIVYTASGELARAGTTIAVDPSVIPYGSEVKINGHTYIAQDTGGGIDGNHIDIYFDDHQEALQFGVQQAEVFLKTGPL